MLSQYQQNLYKALTHIELNLDRKILLNEVAEEAHISPFHFHRIFKAMTGETVKTFVTRLKLERAAMQLKHSNTEIGQIAVQQGYENHESFSRAFKKFFNTTPQEYKLAMQEQTRQRLLGYQTNTEKKPHLSLDSPLIKQLPELHVAYIRHTGAYDKVGKAFQKLVLWAATHLALKLKPTTLGIVHDNPDLTEEEKIRFDACVLLSKAIKPTNEIGYKVLKSSKYAVFRYHGPYDGFYEVYDYIYNVCVFEKNWELGDQPALEWYVKSPPFYKPEQYVTDFFLPLK